MKKGYLKWTQIFNNGFDKDFILKQNQHLQKQILVHS